MTEIALLIGSIAALVLTVGFVLAVLDEMVDGVKPIVIHLQNMAEFALVMMICIAVLVLVVALVLYILTLISGL